VVQELRHPYLAALNTMAPMQTLIGFGIAILLAALLRKILLPGRKDFPSILFYPLLAIVPAIVLFGVSAATSTHFIIPRYLTVVAPGSAFMWAWLTTRIDSRALRQLFCVGLVAITVLQCFRSPLSRRHELNFKAAHAAANANATGDRGQVPVLICSAFIESNFEPLPTSATEENALLSQVSYYKVSAPVIFLPMDLNDETVRIGSGTIRQAAQRRQRFLVVAPPTSYATMEWITNYTRGQFTAQLLGDFNEILVVEFRPVEPVPE
jgi:hypothetical protein